VRGLIEAAGGSAWSYGGAILTFVFPMILFIAVGTVLYVLYSTPHLVPGHRYFVERPAATGTGPVQAASADEQQQGTTAEAGQQQGTMTEGGQATTAGALEGDESTATGNPEETK
jgi:hypothetical protein